MTNNFTFDIESLRDFLDGGAKMGKGLKTMMDMKVEGADATPKDLIFEMDKMKLYHYHALTEQVNTTPVLIVYALVNRQYMMDLDPDKSLIRKMLQGGQDVYIIDWGYPTAEDRYIGLDDYINEYIDSCVDTIRERHGIDKINMMGICQGGTFTFIYTALNPDKVKNIVSLVTPIDFDVDDGLLFKWGPYLQPKLMVEAFGNVPGEFMNAGFLMLKPYDLAIDKYVGVVDLMDDPEKMAGFLRMEQWIFDSPDQVGRAYMEFQEHMYHNNELIKGEFELDGEKVDLKAVTCPVLVIMGTKDNQVPNSATEPIPQVIGSTDVEVLRVETGHIGIFVSGRSQREVGPKINEFLDARDN
ncbi:class III poly(R)-hydroxyalkanoic acid synthase subunit PhaC [Peptoniphilus equinus]|uniref:Poly(3-hydroxyalkanoate) polymerase subunit PhaC n=1 Tax=Peptoniphilus equinus TaxID=3016343 RepID=A0ABY7QSC9_9FIRM|nr:class III poly(R)-hydroxyalkanoic acid synthase subunit PhaC [Peptoniphilus equinus]WBW49699.1 class III poly(R)-hydroxyalkanoic acid synthase subunit PhaC [Peptoniphilus equinus]